MLLFSCKKDYSHLNTEIFGHAGLSLEKRKSQYFPNHIEDVKFALEQTELNGTEIDVQMTSDGELVLFHDQQLDENSSLSGCIPDLTLSEIMEGEFYKTDYPISTLSEALLLLKSSDKKLLLDIKHHNSCSGQNIDFMAFNQSLSLALEVLTSDEKERVTVNSRSLDLLLSISDTSVNKSLESDDPEFAFTAMQTYNISTLVIKLSAMTQQIKTQIELNDYQMGIYNVKTRKENQEAFKFAPDFIISDNIDCTLKGVNG